MSRSIPILMYHLISPDDPSDYAPHQKMYEINSVTPDAFETQMRWLSRRGYQSITLDDVVDHRASGKYLPRRSVVITFDDGYQSTVDYGVPVLQRYGFTAHFFLVAGLVGRTAEWDTETYFWQFPLFDWDTARWLQAQGFRCDAHTLTHQRLGELSTQESYGEIRECQRLLMQELGTESRHFAYPYGSHTEETKAILRDLGFRSSCSVQEGRSSASDDPYALHRVWVTATDSLSDFRWGMRIGAPPKRLPRATARRVRNTLRSYLGRS